MRTIQTSTSTTKFQSHGFRSSFSACFSITHLQVRLSPARDALTDTVLTRLPDLSLEDATIRMTIHNVLEAILNNSQDTPKNVQHNNAQNAVLFESINLAIHLDTESSVVAKAAVLLGRFILSRETNVRYLGLDTMAHLAACAESLEPIKMHQDTIILSLRDKDISVRRRGLDLLYSMCDVTNAKVIVAELLRYLQIADYALREEMVLKIAILTEKVSNSRQ